uniref:Protein kinase domain-containing protein n=2 Tax=Chenopodium quinoa TaxID=63459 RepID=A0A803KTI9_CHEQI
MRESYFRQNGGLLLYSKLSGQDVDILKIFSIQELEIATDNYSDENIIGRGGFGIVYKGILLNNQVVAIKKSLKVNPNQVEQFVNEVLVLSQINNKNVVKLLGCCLESEAPLLVYEFINNGTLYDHLDDPIKASLMKWHVRLNIASEVADVLSYLHNTISTPIIHRDMKSMNILIDERYTAKVSDFGASRLVPSDQDQLATMVLGTWGYLDPEYMQTSELTQKSDVYSFGVVLLELLTRKKVVSNDRPETERGLAMHFILKMKEGRLFDILDKYIVSEETVEEIQKVAILAKWCLMLKGEERPTMKEVAIELETIKRKGSHPWSNNELFQEGDCEFLLGELSISDYGECSIGYDSSTYDSRIVSSLGGGR